MPTYLITGANRGLGLEFARQLSTRGKDTVVLATARDPARAADLARLVHQVIPLDAADPASIAALREHVRDRPIDVLINNAGVSGVARSIADLTPEEFQRVFAVNAYAPLLIAGALLPNLRAGARKLIFNITSQRGSITNNAGGGAYTYGASKAALNHLNATLAHELKPEGFTCVVIHPGWVRTDMGGENAPIEPEQSIAGMLDLIDSLTPEQSGRFLDYQGNGFPW